MLIRWLQKLPALLTNDSIGSMSAGLIMSIMSNTFFTSLQIAAYIWVYENYRLVTLPWDSPITWWIMFFGVDLGYYWFHRMAHGKNKPRPYHAHNSSYSHLIRAEINLFWAAHQVHHSSEYYNLTTALRQSALQRFTSWASQHHFTTTSLTLVFITPFSLILYFYSSVFLSSVGLCCPTHTICCPQAV